MARSAGAAKTVLASLEMLYEEGGNQDFQPADLIRILEALGIEGFTEDQGTYFLMLGTVLRLLLRHAEADVSEMFVKAQADLDELGREIDDNKFDEIARQLENDELEG
jgi:DNA-binding MurR/RpiR family transcriptional regulator